MYAYFPIATDRNFGSVIANCATALDLITLKSLVTQCEISQFSSDPPSAISDKLANTAVLNDIGKDADPCEITFAGTDVDVIIPHCLMAYAYNIYVVSWVCVLYPSSSSITHPFKLDSYTVRSHS